MVVWTVQREDSRGEFQEGDIRVVLSTAKLPQKISADTVISVHKNGQISQCVNRPS